MQIKIKTFGQDSHTILKAEVGVALVTLSKVFSGIEIVTEEGQAFGIAQRDNGLEITAPDGTMVGVKLNRTGKTVVERNCEVVA